MDTFRKLLFVLFTAIGLTLAGCGGGGGGGTPAATTPAAPTLSGTAATGAPLVGATVTVTGANGVTATTTTNAGGTYSVNGTFTYPVLLKVTQTASAITLYSAATAAGTANITPLTNLALILNAALPDNLSTVENTWVATSAAMLTQANMRAAQAIVNANFSTQMTSAGLTPTFYDFLTTTFTANGTGIDSVMDGLLFTFDNTAGTFDITLSDGTTPVLFDAAISTTGIVIGGISAPTGVQAVAGNEQVTISWNPVAGATSYKLYMDTVSGISKTTATTNSRVMHHPSVTSPFVHTGLINNTTYYFVVTALNAVGESVESAQVSAIPTVTQVWQAKADMPTARSSLASAVVNGSIYAIGGLNFDINTTVPTVEAYDTSINSWTTKASMPTARHSLSASAVNGVIYAIGGDNIVAACGTCNGFNPLATVEAYDTSANTWETKASMSIERERFSTVVVNGVIYAIGGLVVDAQNAFVKNSPSVEAYDTATDTWTTKASMSTARSDLVVAAVNGIIYAIGGSGNAGALLTVEAYNPGTNTWTSSAAIPVGNPPMSADVVNNLIYVIREGGTAYSYSPVDNSWTTQTSMNKTTSVTNRTTSVVNNVIYTIGGRDSFGALSAVEAFAP